MLVVDDVITGGTAIRESMDILQGAEAVPAGVVIALDRQVPPLTPTKCTEAITVFLAI